MSTSSLKEAQQQELSLHENEAFLKYAEILKYEPANLLALWKCSELCSRIGARQSDKEKMRPYFNAAKNYAAAALRVNQNSSEANCAMAFALGRISRVSTTRERVILAKDVKHYAENAIRLDPNPISGLIIFLADGIMMSVISAWQRDRLPGYFMENYLKRPWKML